MVDSRRNSNCRIFIKVTTLNTSLASILQSVYSYAISIEVIEAFSKVKRQDSSPNNILFFLNLCVWILSVHCGKKLTTKGSRRPLWQNLIWLTALFKGFWDSLIKFDTHTQPHVTKIPVSFSVFRRFKLTHKKKHNREAGRFTFRLYKTFLPFTFYLSPILTPSPCSTQ